MLTEAMTALAAAGGTAVVQAAATDGWTDLRQRLTAWFGRGADTRQYAELERLDRTAVALDSAPAEHTAQVRERQQNAWQTRIEDLLEELDEPERVEAAAALAVLLRAHAPAAPTAATAPDGIAVAGDLSISAPHGIAAGTIGSIGDVHLASPPAPDRSQG
ncbi:hypothetical protein [Streptomyces sp. NPDC055632]